MTQPIEKTLNVPLRPQQAFDLFTKNLDKWWPLESHSLSAGEGELPKSVNVDRRKGGYVTETRQDGTEGRWATITKWDAGRALSLSWYVGRSEEEATDLEVVFIPTDTGTRIELTHSGFERLADAATAMAQNYKTGWDLVFVKHFGDYCLTKINTPHSA